MTNERTNYLNIQGKQSYKTILNTINLSITLFIIVFVITVASCALTTLVIRSSEKGGQSRHPDGRDVLTRAVLTSQTELLI